MHVSIVAMAEPWNHVAWTKKRVCLQLSYTCNKDRIGEPWLWGGDGCCRARLAPPQLLNAGGGGQWLSPSKALALFSKVWSCRREPNFPSVCFSWVSGCLSNTTDFMQVSEKWRALSMYPSPLHYPVLEAWSNGCEGCTLGKEVDVKKEICMSVQQ